MVANLNKTVSMVFGIVFVAVGLLGFVMNPTLIVFGVNTLHNVVHLLSGAVLLAAAFIDNGKNAKMANTVFGAVYLLVALLGFAAPSITDPLLASDADAVKFADAGLHALLGVVLLGVGLMADKTTAPASTMR